MARSQDSPRAERQVFLLRLLLVVGMVLSLFLLYEHFTPPEGISFCNLGGDFNCETVNRSPYANIDGVLYWLAVDKGFTVPYVDFASQGWFVNLITSNAFLGFGALLLIFFLTFFYEQKARFVKRLGWLERKEARFWLRFLLTFSVLFGLYLIVVMHFLLAAYCIFCLALDIILWGSCALAWMLKK